jgi:hypothetical protein
MRYFPIETQDFFYYYYSMKPFKKMIIAVILLVFPILFAFTAKENIRLILPVRVFAGKKPVTQLQEQDFQLIINNQQRKILKAVKKITSLDQRPDFLGRNFVLSFHTTEYGNQVQEAISYFVTEILSPSDSLILMTPLKIYRINVSPNKGKMRTEIERLVRQDSDEFKKRLNAAEKNLEIQLNRMRRLFRGEIRDPGLATSYKIIGTFLSSFPQGFLSFRSLFLFPEMKNYQKVLGFLGSREGERWWIHFQQGDSFGVVASAQSVAKMIDEYCNLYTLARESFQNNLQQLEKLLRLSESFPVDRLLGVFNSGNIRYNTVLWVHRKHKGRYSTSDIIPFLGVILEKISRDTGGKTINTTDLEQGIKTIHHHQDHYYQLTYGFSGDIEEKKIKVTAVSADMKKLNLSFRDVYSEEEIRSLIQYLSKERVQIDDFSLNKNKIKFSIDDVTLNKIRGDSFGLVKVRIELFSQTGECVYRTENTLRSSKQQITVSIPFPGRHKGKFKLIINACDLIANQLALFEQEVVL